MKTLLSYKILICTSIILILSIHAIAGNGNDGSKNEGSQLSSYLLNYQKLKNSLIKKDVLKASLIGKKLAEKVTFRYTYYRSNFYISDYSIPYDKDWGKDRIVNWGEPNFWEPDMLLRINADITKATSMGTELMLRNTMPGSATDDYYTNVYHALSISTNHSNKYGNFGIQMGGISWKKISAFTFAGNNRYGRGSVFSRVPWSGGGAVHQRYSDMYYKNVIDNSGRFGASGFTGLMLGGWGTPTNTSFEMFYGKTANNGGAERSNLYTPSFNWAGRIGQEVKLGTIAINTFASVEQPDSVMTDTTLYKQFNIYSTDFNFHLKEWKIAGEIGMGSYESMTYEKGWSPGMFIDVSIPEKLTFLPITLRFFHMGANFINRNAAFRNGAIPEANESASLTLGGSNRNVFQGANSASVQYLGSISNNQQGANITIDSEIGDLKIFAGLQFSQELEKLDNSSKIGFSHTINGLKMARLAWESPDFGLGPNERLWLTNRGAYEYINIYEGDTNYTAIDDVSTTVAGDSIYTYAVNTLYDKKYFSSLEFHLKYHNKIFGRNFYVFFLNDFNSIQNYFSPVTVFDNSAWVRQNTHQFEMYYQLTYNIMISMYLGYERIIGNEFTDLNGHDESHATFFDENETLNITTSDSHNYTTSIENTEYISTDKRKPRDQYDRSIGLGLDMSVAKNVNVYVRHYWFSFRDEGFIQEVDGIEEGELFKGTETSIELKIFF